MEQDETNLPPPAPRKGDVLFRGDLPDWWCNACLNVMHRGDETGYVEGYWRGAQRLVEYVIENQRDQDFLVYPIIFLYRHHIELALKRVLMRAPYLIDRELTETERKHLGQHQLDQLWQDFKPMFVSICEKAGWRSAETKSDLEGIEDYIRQLVELDPDSMSFRYPLSKAGKPLLPADLKYINLRHFAEMMERLATHLDAIDSATSHLEETKSEMESAYRDYYGGGD